MKEVRVRIAPSPTGDPHVGTAYIGLFNYVFAKHNGGKFVLRIEDTDQVRSTKESEDQIFEAFKWLGLNYDEGPDVGGEYGPYRQSERTAIYQEHAKKLIEDGVAYYCFCSSERLMELREEQKANKTDIGYDGHCRDLSKEEVEEKLKSGVSYVIRLKMPKEGETIVVDELRGEVKFANARIDDQVLIKSDGFPTYHLANVVDDHLMKISHVIRAEEWIASTPKHIQLYRAFGWEEPKWVHMPLLRNADKTKISKRKNPVSLNYYKDEGYLEESMLNFLALMGWSIGGDREKFTLEEMVKEFDFKKVSLGGPVFDLKKLGWLNNLYIREMDLSEVSSKAKEFYIKKGYLTSETLSEQEEKAYVRVVEIARESAEMIAQLPEKSKVFFEDEFELEEKVEGMNKKQRKSIDKMYSALEAEVGKNAIALFKEKISAEDEIISEERAIEILNEVMEEIGEGPGKVLMPLRVVVTGASRGPDLYTVIGVIGRDRVLKRVERIVNKYEL